MKFKVTIKPSKNFNVDNVTINAISIYQAVLFAEDILRGAGVSPCNILMVKVNGRYLDREQFKQNIR